MQLMTLRLQVLQGCLDKKGKKKSGERQNNDVSWKSKESLGDSNGLWSLGNQHQKACGNSVENPVGNNPWTKAVTSKVVQTII